MIEDNRTTRLFLLGIVALIVSLVVSMLIAHILMGGATSVKVGSAPTLLGEVAQDMLSQSRGARTSAGYSIQNVRYFDNNTWVVAKVVPPVKSGDIGYVVMWKSGKFYIPALGPGTNFPSTSTIGLPADVAGYLSSQGLVYNNAS